MHSRFGGNFTRGQASIWRIAALALLAVALFSGPTLAQTASGRRLEVLVAPPRGSEPKDIWYAVVWSLPRATVDVVNRQNDLTPNTTRGTGLAIAVDDHRLRGNFDSRAIPAPPGRLATVVLKKTFSAPVQPWRANAKGFSMDIPLRIHALEQQGSVVSYIGATFVLTSARTKHSFWLQVQLFDSRGTQPQRGAGTPAYQARDRLLCSPTRSTQLPILSATAGTESRFVRFAPGSPALMHRGGLSGTFRLNLTRENMHAMLAALDDKDHWCTAESGFTDADLDFIELKQASVMVETQFGKLRAGETSPGDFSRLDFEVHVPTISAD